MHLPTMPQDAAGQAIAAQVFAPRIYGFFAQALIGPTTTVAPAAGGAGALPATPRGYLTDELGRKIAFY